MTRRILVIDASPAGRAVTQSRLAGGYYSAVFVDTVEDAIPALRRAPPDVVLIDTPDPTHAVLQLRRRHRDLPVIVLLPEGADRLPPLRAGAVDVLTTPVDETVLMARLRASLRVTAQEDDPHPVGLAEEGAGFEMPATIAFVSDRTDGTARLRAELALHSSDRLDRISREQALAAACVPDLYVIEAGLGGADGGLRLMSDLRARTETRHVPVCIIDTGSAPHTAAMAWDLGADEVVPLRTGAAEMALRLGILLRMKRRQDRRRASVAQGLRMAMVDPLTGLHNRRFATPRLEVMAHGDLAVLLVDLDLFKSVNDRWGHAAGDSVLREVASRLSNTLRPGDLAARIGGEEFLIALPDTQLATAIEIADRLCHRVAATPVLLPSGEGLIVTVSVGLATRRKMSGEPVADTIDRADRALLQSKGAGRNRVTVASSPSEWTKRIA